MLRFALLVLAVAVWVIGATGESYAEKGVALVIGNSDYKHTLHLPNPKNDANAIAAALNKIGFESVTVEIDLGIDGMRRALRAFGDKAEGADTALVFFAGHGMELGGENYLIPTDAKLRKDRHLQFEAVKLSSVLQSVEGARRLKLVMLDACRNNPFAAGMRLSGKVKRSVARGFGRIEPEGDVLVAYASRHGTTADDGAEKHSPYTTALLAHMSEPGIDIRLMLGKVRDSVKAATSGEQVPHIYGTLGGRNVYLVPPKPGTDRARVTALELRLKELEAKLKAKNETKVAVGVFPKKPKVTPKQTLEPGAEFQDCSDCPKMVVIPAGSFLMGSPDSEASRDSDEGPQRKVTIPRAFAVGKFEVTVDQFAAFVRETGRDMGSRCSVWSKSKRIWQIRSGRNYRSPGYSQTGSHPAACVDWQDAKSYVSWLARKTGKPYRLLTEAEWEYATRAGTTTRFHFGAREKDLCAYANGADRSTSFDWRNKSCSDGVGDTTAAVGTFKANAFGLHDLLGNVWEWVEDCWNQNYPGTPTDSSYLTTGNCNLRVLRGGSWNNGPGNLRSADRYGGDIVSPVNDTGFRVARTLAAEAKN